MTTAQDRVQVNNPTLDPRLAPVQQHKVPSEHSGNLITLVDRCWVCGASFPEYGGLSLGLVQEFHHPVPRAFGGSSGPVISICSGHHTNVHDVSLRIISGVPYHDLVGHELPQSQSRIIRLANIIVQAMSLFKDDPNRIVPINYGLSFQKNELLKMAARSRKIPVRRLLDLIVEDFLKKEYPKRRTKP